MPAEALYEASSAPEMDVTKTTEQQHAQTKSKTALKRERKELYWNERKHEMKKRKKDAKKSQKRAQGVLNEIRQETERPGEPTVEAQQTSAEVIASKPVDELREARMKRKIDETKEYLKLCSNTYSVIIDCNFESDHNDKSIGDR